MDCSIRRERTALNRHTGPNHTQGNKKTIGCRATSSPYHSKYSPSNFASLFPLLRRRRHDEDALEWSPHPPLPHAGLLQCQSSLLRRKLLSRRLLLKLCNGWTCCRARGAVLPRPLMRISFFDRQSVPVLVSLVLPPRFVATIAGSELLLRFATDVAYRRRPPPVVCHLHLGKMFVVQSVFDGLVLALEGPGDVLASLLVDGTLGASPAATCTDDLQLENQVDCGLLPLVVLVGRAANIPILPAPRAVPWALIADTQSCGVHPGLSARASAPRLLTQRPESGKCPFSRLICPSPSKGVRRASLDVADVLAANLDGSLEGDAHGLSRRPPRDDLPV